MKILNILYLIVSVFFLNSLISTNIISKSFPNNLKISNDGRILILSSQNSSGLYNLEQLKTIYLDFEYSDWWQRLTQNYKTKTDLPATLTYDGQKYYNVGVRFRGQTSYQRIGYSQKKSFNISVDYLDSNQKLDGYKTLNLNNCFEDPSFIREVLYSTLAGKHIPIAKSNFVKLCINGQNWGVYTNVQQLNKDFISEWFLSNNGSLWRAEIPDTSSVQKEIGQQGGFGAGYCSLNYLGDDFLSYTRFYTLKTSSKENPWFDLVKACERLNNLPIENLYDSLKFYFDVDRCLWHIANEIIWTDDDSYVNKGGMDYYIYYDADTKRIQPIEYDGNSTFTTRNVAWNPFLKENDSKYPLISKLLRNPELKQRYVAHIRTIIKDLMNPEYVNPIIDKYYNLIQTEVNNDTKKLYSFSQFTNSITEIKTFISNRRTNLLNNQVIKAQPPTIHYVFHTNPKGEKKAPKANEYVICNAKVESLSGISKVLLYYSVGLMGPFDRIQMFDDGKHDDGVENDGIYGATIKAYPAGTYIRYYVEAISANQYNSSVYSPEGAEHNVFFYQVEPEIEENFPVVINELMASNSTTIADPQGEYDDWIELFNKGNETIDLSGLYLSDKADNLKKWKFPDNTKINSGEYLLVWCDENSKATPGIHTNFKLSADGEIVFFINSDDKGNTILDSVSFGKQQTDISYGRYPNGEGKFYLMTPTPGKYNDNTLTNVTEFITSDDIKIDIYPNPFSDFICIDINSNKKPFSIEVFDTQGNKLQDLINQRNNNSTNRVFWNSLDKQGNKIANGIYFLRIISGNSYLVKPIIKY